MRGFSVVGLTQPKFALNVGGVFRAAHCYEASMIVIEGKRYERQCSDTTKTWRHTPLIRTDDVLDACPYDCVPVAIELCDGATSLVDFTHPERAFYIFGPEDGSVPQRVLDKCPLKVQVPTRVCMNLAATVNVVLYDRKAKAILRTREFTTT